MFGLNHSNQTKEKRGQILRKEEYYPIVRKILEKEGYLLRWFLYS